MAHIRTELPFYVLVSRKGPRTIPEAIPARAPVLDGTKSREALLGYRHRASAAAWVEREGRHLRILPVRSASAMDRLAASTLVQTRCRWLALEPTLRGLATECFVDLAEWLAERQPWSQDLYGFCRTHDLELELPKIVAEFAA